MATTKKKKKRKRPRREQSVSVNDYEDSEITGEATTNSRDMTSPRSPSESKPSPSVNVVIL